MPMIPQSRNLHPGIRDCRDAGEPAWSGNGQFVNVPTAEAVDRLGGCSVDRALEIGQEAPRAVEAGFVARFTYEESADA